MLEAVITAGLILAAYRINSEQEQQPLDAWITMRPSEPVRLTLPPP
jgi:hypothetical protein